MTVTLYLLADWDHVDLWPALSVAAVDNDAGGQAMEIQLDWLFWGAGLTIA
jgi:hypothetical protein